MVTKSCGGKRVGDDRGGEAERGIGTLPDSLWEAIGLTEQSERDTCLCCD